MEESFKWEGFVWDLGNIDKNWTKHGVSKLECEEVFFNVPLLWAPDEGHSSNEIRFYALGSSGLGRHLFIVFTVRRNRVRVISARDMSRKERKIYENKKCM